MKNKMDIRKREDGLFDVDFFVFDEDKNIIFNHTMRNITEVQDLNGLIIFYHGEEYVSVDMKDDFDRISKNY
jgi:hypothetical protein